jgi:hypothetical protein
MAHVIGKDKEQVLRQVEDMGISKGAVLEFLFSLKCMFMTEPALDSIQVNSRMIALGWQDVGLDDKVLKSVTTYFKAETQIN